jgi:hypothetical protein
VDQAVGRVEREPWGVQMRSGKGLWQIQGLYGLLPQLSDLRIEQDAQTGLRGAGGEEIPDQRERRGTDFPMYRGESIYSPTPLNVQYMRAKLQTLHVNLPVRLMSI